MLFKHQRGDLPVDFCSGQLFQKLGALFWLRIEKRSELPLRQQHGAGKASVIQPGKRCRHLQLIFDLIGEDFSVGAARQLHARHLQVSVRLIAGAVLAPESAVRLAFNLELHFSKAFGRIAGHQIVLRLRNGAQARRLVIERKTDGVEQRGFPRAGRPGDGKQPVAGKRFCREIDFPFSLQGVEVFQAQAENFHASASPASVCTVALNS